jgi:hypothetical protein
MGKSVLVFGAANLTVTFSPQFLEPGFGSSSGGEFDLEMPFNGGSFLVLRVRQNTAGAGGATMNYSLVVNGTAVVASTVSLGTGIASGEAVFAFPYVDSDRVAVQLVMTGVLIGITAPSNVIATLAFSAPSA